MNASLIPTIVVSLFLVAIILGFLFGWVRGFSKSLVRFIIVLAVAVLTFFVVPSITTAILKADISKFNINIGGVQVITIGDMISDLLGNIPAVQDLIHASPTFEAVMTLAPQMIANVVLFIVFFFIFKWVSMIIYWIFAGIFFSKKKMGDKDRHKFIGAVIGTIQGVLVALVIMIPVYGMIETSRPLVQAMQASQEQEAEQTPPESNGFVYTVEEGEGSGETEEENKDKSEIEVIEGYTNLADEYLKAFDNTWIIKFFKAIKVQDLSVAMFDNLTTVKDRNLEVALRSEVNTIAEAYPGLRGLLVNNVDLEDDATYDKLKESFNILYKSPVLSGIVKEVVPEAASRWSDPTLSGDDAKFCGISKPTFEDKSLNRLFDALLLNLSTSEGDDVQTDINTTIDVMKVCASSGLIKCINGDADLMDTLLLDKNSHLIENIIDISLQSTTLKNILPDLINAAMNQVYSALEITDAPEITLTSDDVTWNTEKVYLQNVFTNILKLFKQIQDGENAETPMTALESINFETIGALFDNLRYSQLLGPGSKSIMNKVLDKSLSSDSTILDKFRTKLNEVWDDKDVNMAQTFKAVQEAIELSKKLEKASEDFNKDSIGDILNTISESEALQDTVKEILSDKEILKDIGLDDKTAGLVQDTVGAVLENNYSDDPELAKQERAKDIEAVKEIYDVANKVMSNDSTSEEKVTLEQEDSQALIDAIADSKVIKDKLTSDSSQVKDLDFGSNLDDTTKATLKDQIENVDESKLDSAQKDALKALFGIA